MDGYFTVSLHTNSFSPTDNVVVMTVTATQSAYAYMTVMARTQDQIDLIKGVLGIWPELVDITIAKAQQDLEQLGLPSAKAGEAQAGRVSPYLRFECVLSYRTLYNLSKQMGSMRTTGFFPAHILASE